jgi:MFS superfamily sulfate permease-like transporter
VAWPNQINRYVVGFRAETSQNCSGGFFATMGGCAMIGQSMININNGARHRISGISGISTDENR